MRKIDLMVNDSIDDAIAERVLSGCKAALVVFLKNVRPRILAEIEALMTEEDGYEPYPEALDAEVELCVKDIIANVEEEWERRKPGGFYDLMEQYEKLKKTWGDWI